MGCQARAASTGAADVRQTRRSDEIRLHLSLSQMRIFKTLHFWLSFFGSSLRVLQNSYWGSLSQGSTSAMEIPSETSDGYVTCRAGGAVIARIDCRVYEFTPHGARALTHIGRAPATSEKNATSLCYGTRRLRRMVPYLFQQGCSCIELYCTVHTAHAHAKHALHKPFLSVPSTV